MMVVLIDLLSSLSPSLGARRLLLNRWSTDLTYSITGSHSSPLAKHQESPGGALGCLNGLQDLYILPCKDKRYFFLSADKTLAIALSCSRILSTICSHDPQRVFDSVISWWAGRPSWIWTSARSRRFVQLYKKLLTSFLQREMALVMHSVSCEQIQ